MTFARLCRRGAPDGAPEGTTLRLRGLPYSATEVDIVEFFKGASRSPVLM